MTPTERLRQYADDFEHENYTDLHYGALRKHLIAELRRIAGVLEQVEAERECYREAVVKFAGAPYYSPDALDALEQGKKIRGKS